MAIERKLGEPTRDAYGKALVQLGRRKPEIVVLDADLSSSTRTAMFGKEFPDRFFNCGVSEANMIGVASGLAASGHIPFISSFACFMLCKGYDQLRMSVAYPMMNVKCVASHGGISVGEDGASQQSIEDLALATSLPNFTVMIPADQFATTALVIAATEMTGPVYIRTCRPKAPIIYNESSQFQIGKGIVLREGKDATIIACGLEVFEALVAQEELARKGREVAVVDMPTIKPLDEALVIKQAKATGAIVTAEEHQIWGGLGSAAARVLSQGHPVPMEFVAIQDSYAESGKPEELFEKYGLTARHIVQAVERVIAKKR